MGFGRWELGVEFGSCRLGVSIRINGEPHEIDAPVTISELLAQLHIDSRRVAVEHNLIVVKRHLYDATVVDNGDTIEIVNFVGGGSSFLTLAFL